MDNAATDPIAALHEAVDDLVLPLAEAHAGRLRCERGCSSCCVDDLTVFEVEAAPIRLLDAELLRTGTPHPEGACAFLDDRGACRIYERRPYVCRTQGYPLRWLDDVDGVPVELRDICPLNDQGGPPIEDLPAELCWTIGPFEDRLALLQRASGDGSMTRVRLRDLFERPTAPPPGPLLGPDQSLSKGDGAPGAPSDRG